MKKHLLLLGALAASVSFGQTVPNGDMENWTTLPGYTIPTGPNGYKSSNAETYINTGLIPVSQETSPNGFGLQLETYNSGAEIEAAYYQSAHTFNDATFTLNGGYPYTQIPDSIGVRLRYNFAPGGEGLFAIQFTKDGIIEGEIFNQLIVTGSSNDTTIYFPLESPITNAPDSVTVTAATFDFFDPGVITEGDYLIIDDVTIYSGGTGTLIENYENWTSYGSLERIDDWSIRRYNVEDPNILKTTDAHSGLYATELHSYDDDGEVRSTWFTLGTPDCESGPSCESIPAFAVNSSNDEVRFWYKMSSPGLDTSFVFLNYTRWNGSSRDGVGHAETQLPPVNDWTEVVLNSSFSGTPDSLSINFYTSHNGDQSVAGTTLIVDDFSINGTITSLSSVENTSSMALVVENLLHRNNNDEFTLIDVNGRIVLSGKEHIINMSSLTPGKYILVEGSTKYTILKK